MFANNIPSRFHHLDMLNDQLYDLIESKILPLERQGLDSGGGELLSQPQTAKDSTSILSPKG